MAMNDQQSSGLSAKVRDALQRNSVLLRNAGSLAATTGLTSLFGFVFTIVAARSFSPNAVGWGNAAINAMQLFGTIGMFGLGTMLIGELPKRKQDGESRGGLVSASIAASAIGSVTLGLIFALIVGLHFNKQPSRDRRNTGRGAALHLRHRLDQRHARLRRRHDRHAARRGAAVAQHGLVRDQARRAARHGHFPARRAGRGPQPVLRDRDRRLGGRRQHHAHPGRFADLPPPRLGVAAPPAPGGGQPQLAQPRDGDPVADHPDHRRGRGRRRTSSPSSTSPG